MSVLSTLFGNRFSKSSKRRRGHDARLNHNVRSNRLEGLEKRQMLTVDMAPEVNIRFDQNVNANSGNTIVTITPVVGEDGIELTYDDNGDAVWVQRAFDGSNLNADAVSFYTSPTLDVTSRLGWANDGELFADLILEDSSLTDIVAGGEGSSVVRSFTDQGFNFDSSTNGFKSFTPGASVDISYVSKAQNLALPTKIGRLARVI